MTLFATGPRVVMVPDYRETNPYQRLLADALTSFGTIVAFAQPSGRRIFPLSIAARNFDVDIVHLHWVTPFLRDWPVPIYALYAARLLLDVGLTRAAGANVVWTIHNKVSHEARHPRFESWVRRRLARMVDAMIVHSPEIRREIAADLGKASDAFDIVPHASFGDVYGAALDSHSSRSALGLLQTGRVFLNFGRMRPYKGLRRLLDAWSASGLGTAGHTLLLAGEFDDPAFESDIVSSAARIAGVRVDVGLVPDERVRLYFGACDAVVLPFEKILTSGSMHLAITFEAPIVAPRMTSVVETLADADAFTYDPDTTGGLQDALARCAAADLTDLRRKMKSLRASLLDWNGVALATLAVYQRVSERRPKRHRGMHPAQASRG